MSREGLRRVRSMHWKLVVESMVDAIYSKWWNREETTEEMIVQIERIPQYERECQIDQIDLDHYLEGSGE